METYVRDRRKESKTIRQNNKNNKDRWKTKTKREKGHSTNMFSKIVFEFCVLMCNLTNYHQQD